MISGLKLLKPNYSEVSDIVKYTIGGVPDKQSQQEAIALMGEDVVIMSMAEFNALTGAAPTTNLDMHSAIVGWEILKDGFFLLEKALGMKDIDDNSGTNVAEHAPAGEDIAPVSLPGIVPDPGELA